MQQLKVLPNIVKRNGFLQPFRHSKLSWELSTTSQDLARVVDTLAGRLCTQISSHDLQVYAASVLASHTPRHPDYGVLAGRMLVADLHKGIGKSFAAWADAYGSAVGLHPDILDVVIMHGPDLDNALVHSRDYDMSYFRIKRVLETYLAKCSGVVCERPQFMYMRLAIAIHGSDLANVLRTYDALSRGLYSHATPILCNAGTLDAKYASCFLYEPDSSSRASLLQSVADLDTLWLAQGGVGLSMASVPAYSGPEHPGVLHLMKLYDAHATFVGSAGMRRPAAATVYLPIWHLDIRSHVVCRTTRAAPDMRVNHIFPAVWIPDVFMRRLKNDGEWSLFNPEDVPFLLDLHGDDFTAAYEGYEASDVPRKTLPARVLFAVVCDAQRESGTPFLLYQDILNAKNNQRHLGVVKCSNLCTEIVQFSSKDETAVCTLASVALPRFVKDDLTFDFPALHEITTMVVRNTDLLIDRGSYPTERTRQSALASRALGVGVQGFGDCLRELGIPYGSRESSEFNKDVFETIYHAALQTSADLAKELGPYPRYAGSPASCGILQMDMWSGMSVTGRYDFGELRDSIRQFGLRNAMLTAQMPTAATGHILGNSEGTEPRTSNITTHHVLSGQFTEVCPWLVKALTNHGLWTAEVRAAILRDHGSIANVPGVPDHVKAVFRTAWEIAPEHVVDMAADRGPYIDQSQSMSLYVAWPDVEHLMALQIRAWERGLKTGLYYLRCRAPTFPFLYGVPLTCAVDPSGDSSDGEPPSLESVTPSEDAGRESDEPDTEALGEGFDGPPAEYCGILLDKAQVDDRVCSDAPADPVCVSCSS